MPQSRSASATTSSAGSARRSALRIRRVEIARDDPLPAGRRQLDQGRVAVVAPRVLEDREPARDDDGDALARLRSAWRGARDDAVRGEVEDPARVGDELVVGLAQRTALERFLDLRRLEYAHEVAVRVAAEGQLGVERV